MPLERTATEEEDRPELTDSPDGDEGFPTLNEKPTSSVLSRLSLFRASFLSYSEDVGALVVRSGKSVLCRGSEASH
jgi:hypothetical protein